MSIALATLSSKIGMTEDNIKKALDTIDYAVENGAELIAFGECYTSGYSGEDLIQDLAEPIPGKTIDIFHQKAKEKGQESKCKPGDAKCAQAHKALQAAAGKASEAATLAKAAAK